VNIASRAQSVAEAGQILVTQAVYDKVRSDLAGSRAQEYRLKRFENAVDLYAA
jgi:class 3 adenylate cyclase